METPTLDSAFWVFINILLQAVIPVLVTALLGVLVIAARKGVTLLQERVGESQWAQVVALVDFVVKAAEQAGLKGALEDEGRIKKAWAINELKRLLEERGLGNIDVDTLSTLIEAAIRDGVHQQNPVANTALNLGLPSRYDVTDRG